jgi:hypothetical protein
MFFYKSIASNGDICEGSKSQGFINNNLTHKSLILSNKYVYLEY